MTVEGGALSARLRRAAPWLALIALSAALHLWDLGGRTYHHDEAIHAKLSLDLLERGSYRYDPTYHGPLLYLLTAATYAVAGASDLTARLPTALAGIGMVWVAWRMRRMIGGRAAWWTGLLFTLSPLLLYYGRFHRMDTLEMLCASGALLAWWDVLRDRKGAWPEMAAWAGLAFATKENAYVTAALLGITAVLLGLDRGLAGAVPAAVRWLTDRWRQLLGAAAVFLAVTVPLYTVGFSHPEDWLFPVKAIGYWWGQHTVQRVAGPWWFHLPRLAQYEFLVLIAAAVWVVRRWRRLRGVELFLLVFGIASVGMYCWLGEKVPWLGVHQVWPFVPLAGCQLARTFGPHGRRWGRAVAGLGLAASAATALVAVFVLDEISPARRRVESLIFVQSCPEVQAVVGEIEAAAAEPSTVPVAMVSGEAAWPLSWYLRDLPVGWTLPTAGTRPAVVVCDLGSEASVRKVLGPGYVRERIPLRAWWLMEQRPPSAGELVRYLVNRVPWGGIGSTDVLVLRRGDGGTAPTREAAVPAALAATLGAVSARIVAEGFVAEPRGVAADRPGILVADPALAQVLRVGASGEVERGMSGLGLQQPEAAAWLRTGEVVVADTWNHRVVRATLGGGPDGVTELPPPTGGWYGPRGVAVSAEGRLAVTDTGNKRLVVYGPGLDDPRVVTGELDEPGGVAWGDDQHVVVCDTGNRRLAVVEVATGTVGSVELPGAWPNYYSRPQVTVLGPGRWLASDTPQQLLWLVERGAVTRVDLAPEGIAPTGLAWDPAERRLVVGDLGGRVWVVEVADG